jgi:hypothetical protein
MTEWGSRPESVSDALQRASDSVAAAATNPTPAGRPGRGGPGPACHLVPPGRAWRPTAHRSCRDFRHCVEITDSPAQRSADTSGDFLPPTPASRVSLL